MKKRSHMNFCKECRKAFELINHPDYCEDCRIALGVAPWEYFDSDFYERPEIVSEIMRQYMALGYE